MDDQIESPIIRPHSPLLLPLPSVPAGSKHKTRGTYTSKACITCRQTKSKCTGGLQCHYCHRVGKDCIYPDRGRKGRSKISASRDNNLVENHGMVRHPGNEAVLQRLENLEQQLTRLDKTFNCRQDDGTESFPPDSELFKVTSCYPVSACLSSHIEAVKKSMLPKAFGQPKLQHVGNCRWLSGDNKIPSRYLGGLPSVSKLNYLVDLYFEYANHFFPCVDEVDLKRRLSQLLGDYSNDARESPYQFTEPSTFLMLVYMILAVATTLDPSTYHRRIVSPGWKYLLLAEELLGQDQFSLRNGSDLDFVCYQTLKAVYMIYTERTTAAYRSIGVAVQLAFTIGLNNESTWTRLTENEKLARRTLWWTIFYVDRRIAQKCWTPYLIRENEVMVDDDFHDTRTTTSDVIQDVTLSPGVTETSSITHYISTTISWARLWTMVWDTLFALRQPVHDSAAASEKIDILDVRILHAQRNVHNNLSWNSSRVLEYVSAGESEAQIRSRLVVHVRFNLLRLLIRQSWQHTFATDPRGSEICIELATNTIDAVIAFMNTTANRIPFGLSAVECVVESMCHLVPHIRTRKGIDAAGPISAFNRAIDFLQNLSANLGAAKRALDVLGEIAEKGWLEAIDNENGLSANDFELSPDFVQDLHSESLDEFFSSDWSQVCLPGPDMMNFWGSTSIV